MEKAVLTGEFTAISAYIKVYFVLLGGQLQGQRVDLRWWEMGGIGCMVWKTQRINKKESLEKNEKLKDRIRISSGTNGIEMKNAKTPETEDLVLWKMNMINNLLLKLMKRRNEYSPNETEMKRERWLQVTVKFKRS